MGRPSNTDQRRQEITGALLRVMARHGVRGATVSAIAEEAGITPGLIHYHFGTKGEILLAAVERLRSVVRERFRRRAGREGSYARGRLYAWIDAHVALGPDAESHAMAAAVALGAEALRDAEVRNVYEKALAEEKVVLEGLVKEALAADRRSPRGAGSLAAALLASVQGAFLLGCAAPRTIPRGAAAPLLRKMADGLLDAEPRVMGRVR